MVAHKIFCTNIKIIFLLLFCQGFPLRAGDFKLVIMGVSGEAGIDIHLDVAMEGADLLSDRASKGFLLKRKNDSLKLC